MRLKRCVMMSVVILCGSLWAAASSSETARALAEIEVAYAKVQGFQAEVLTRHQTSQDDVVATRILTISKKYGWKVMDWIGDQRREIINNFKTNVVYLREQKKVVRLTASNPELEAEFRKPVTELNPVLLLDRKTLRLIGTEEFEGEPVYHFKGTTTTQMLQRGKPVTVGVEAWVSRHDGIPRKTIETIGEGTGTTIYRRVTLRPDLTPDDFQFQKPADVIEMEIPVEESESAGATSAPEDQVTTSHARLNGQSEGE